MLPLLLLVLLALLPATPAWAAVVRPSEAFYVLDQANVLSDALENEILDSNQRLNRACGAQIVVVTVHTTGSEAIDDYANALFNQWGIGDKGKNNGFLLLLAVGDDNYYALCGSGLQCKFSRGQVKQYLDDYLEADFAAKRYEEGVIRLFNAVYARVAVIYGVDNKSAVKLPAASPTPMPTVAKLGSANAIPKPTRTPPSTMPPKNLDFDVPAPTRQFYVLDEAGVLSEDVRCELFFYGQGVYEDCGGQIVVATVRTTGGVHIDRYAYKLFKEWGIGSAEYQNGVLLLMAIDDGNYIAVQGIGCYRHFLDSDTMKKCEPLFAAGDYEAVARTFASDAVGSILAEMQRAGYLEKLALLPSTQAVIYNSRYRSWKEDGGNWESLSASGGGGIAYQIGTDRATVQWSIHTPLSLIQRFCGHPFHSDCVNPP